MNVARKQKSRRKITVRATPNNQPRDNSKDSEILKFLKANVPKGSIAKTLELAGGALGPWGAVAAPVGKYIGNKISAITGFGDYTVHDNTLTTQSGVVPEGTQIPQFVNSDHSTRVSHREFIRDILVPTNPADFNNIAEQINPANSNLFPWLSTLAPSFSQYKVNGMVFEFRTMSSDITTGGALGTVVMATNYDSVDLPYPNKVVMENAQYSVSCKPSVSMIHAIECDPSMTASKLLYVRNGSSTLNVDKDARFYDMGIFQVATKGLPGTTNQVLGELWVSYDVTLYKPEISAASRSLNNAALNSFNSRGTIGSSSPVGNNPLRTGTAGYESLIRWDNIAPNLFRFSQPGRYLIEFSSISTGTKLLCDFLPTAGVTVTNVQNNSNYPGATGSYLFFVDVTVSDGAVQYITTGTFGNVTAVQINFIATASVSGDLLPLLVR